VDKSKLVVEALIEVNKIRAALGKKPLSRLRKGERNRPNGCPIARSIGDSACVGVYGISAHLETQERAFAWRDKVCAGTGLKPAGKANVNVRSPVAVRNFVKAFDRGELVEFVK